MKKCSKCQVVKNKELFVKSKSEKDGLFSYCKECKNKYDKNSYTLNRDKRRVMVGVYRERNAERVSAAKRAEYIKNQEVYLKKARDSYRSNREAILERNKAKRAEDPSFYVKAYKRIKERRESDPGFRAIMNVRQRLAQFLRSKSGNFSKKLGCDLATLKSHIEAQFQPGMSWDNYGEWHLDHKISLAKAWSEGEVEFTKSCNYKNLQPLWALENIRKGKK